MYMIYADGTPIYDPRLVREGYNALAPKVTVELNKAGSCDFTLPPTNVTYDDIRKLKSVIVVKQNEETIFRGRVLNDEEDFYKQKKTYCEGQLAFFLDSIVRPYIKTKYSVSNFLKLLIDNHNSRVDEWKRFELGKVGINKTIECESTNYPTTIDEINEKILNVVGGNVIVRESGNKRYIDLLPSSPEDGEVNMSSQVIEFGVNLLDLTKYATGENVFTIIIPLGATLESSDGSTSNERVTIKEHPGQHGKDYIEDETGIALFGRIERVITFDDINNELTLYQEAKKTLKNNIGLSTSITMTAIDLSLLGVNTNAIHVGDWVPLISVPHGINKIVQCTKIVYDLENPESNEYSFGNLQDSLTSQTAKKMNKLSQGGVRIITETTTDEGGTT